MINVCLFLCMHSNNSTHRLMMRQQLFLTTATHWRRRSVSKRNGGSLRNRRETLRGRERTSQRLLFAWGERYSKFLTRHHSRLHHMLWVLWLQRFQSFLKFNRKRPFKRTALLGSRINFWTWLPLLTVGDVPHLTVTAPCQSVSLCNLRRRL